MGVDEHRAVSGGGSDWVVGPPGWHLLFLAGVSATASGLALLRDVRRVETVLIAAGGVLAVVARRGGGRGSASDRRGPARRPACARRRLRAPRGRPAGGRGAGRARGGRLAGVRGARAADRWPGWAAALLAVPLVRLLDDPAGVLATASPTSLPRRRVPRLTVALPLAAAVWLAVLALSEVPASSLEAAALVAASSGSAPRGCAPASVSG